MNTETALRNIISKIAEVPVDFSFEADLRNELDVDSFRFAEISFEIERTFSLKLPDDKYAVAQTARDILQLIQSC